LYGINYYGGGNLGLEYGRNYGSITIGNTAMFHIIYSLEYYHVERYTLGGYKRDPLQVQEYIHYICQNRYSLTPFPKIDIALSSY